MFRLCTTFLTFSPSLVSYGQKEGGGHHGRVAVDGFIGSVIAYLGSVACSRSWWRGLFGYTAEEESKGNRLFWAEWPLPGTGEPVSPAIERVYLKAA
jgi:hypothetical protein